MKKRFIAAGLGIGVLVGSAGLASALTAQTDSTTPTDSVSTPADDTVTTPADDTTDTPADDANETADDANETADDANEVHEGRGGMAEEVLTGQIATDVTAAAQTAAPGSTVDMVETNGRGDGYEASVNAADGTQSKINFDLDLNVVDVSTGGGGHEGGGHDGGHGRGGHDGDGPHGAPLEAGLAADLTAAAEAAVPGGTVDSVSVEGNRSGAAYEAHVTDADGNSVEVTFDADLNVLDIAQD
jgi:uncharacterized membrane protein YkoI